MAGPIGSSLLSSGDIRDLLTNQSDVRTNIDKEVTMAVRGEGQIERSFDVIDRTLKSGSSPV
jgi:hypothetical protein